MYKDTKRNRWMIPLVIIMIMMSVFAVRSFINERAGKDSEEESILAIKTAVEKSALQCYVVEGAYPPDLKYLEDNYGLKVNTDKYYVVYNAYAENQLPDIRVVKK